MPENERLPAPGARRLFDALEAVHYLDADTDEELDLFVCDLLSDADKFKFEERIRQDPRLADEVQQRKADLDADLNAGQWNELTGSVLREVSDRVNGPQLVILPEQSSLSQKIRQTRDEKESAFGAGWKLPAWFLIAAALVALIGIAAVMLNRAAHQGADQGLARNRGPDVPRQSSSPNAADIATNMERHGKDQSVALNTGFEALLAKPEIAESGLKIMGAENPEIERKYGGNTLSIAYFDGTTKKLPFVFLPVQFEKGTAKVVDKVSQENISRLASFLKSISSIVFRARIEVHPQGAKSLENEALMQNRAQMLRSLLEAQGVPHSIFDDAKSFTATNPLTTPPQTVSDIQSTVLIIREH